MAVLYAYVDEDSKRSKYRAHIFEQNKLLCEFSIAGRSLTFAREDTLKKYGEVCMNCLTKLRTAEREVDDVIGVIKLLDEEDSILLRHIKTKELLLKFYNTRTWDYLVSKIEEVF